MKRLSLAPLCALAAVVLAGTAHAEKLKGVVWDIQPLVVEGVEVVIHEKTKIERKKHPNITAPELRIGWEVEVEGKPDAGRTRLVAKKIKVKTARHEKVEVEGYVESLGEYVFDVEGRRVRWSGIDRTPIRPGAHVEIEGNLLDDGTIELRELEVKPSKVDEAEAEFMALAASELETLKTNLDYYDDRLFQTYVASVGHSLVPEWVDRNRLNFNFAIVNDPELNAFALPDGTIVIHTGLLATLENEAQLATVLGHEIAHVVHKHGYRGYRRAKKLQWVAIGAAIAGATLDSDREPWEGPSWASALVQVGAALSLSAAMNGHGRNLEDDADRIGLNYAIDAGYDPFEAPEVWRIFMRHTGDRDAVANWFFSNHSTHRARIGNLTQEINRFHRGHVDPAKLNRNEQEYARMVSRLRRHNAIMDYQRKEYRNAETAFRAILEDNSADAMAHLYMGKILWDTRGMAGADAALGAMTKATELDPELADPYREMGFVYYSLGYHDSAVAALQKYVDMAPMAIDASEIRGYIRDLSR